MQPLMDHCHLTLRAADLTITEGYLADWVNAFYGHMAVLIGMDEWEVSFKDVTDPDIGRVYATVMFAGFKHALEQFVKPVAS